VGESLEWIQCKGCGRRHRWSPDVAGRVVECTCGSAIEMPEGPASGPLSDPEATLIEDVDSPTASAPDLSELGLDDLAEDLRQARKRTLIGASARRAEKRLIWATVLWLVGIGVFIHALLVQWDAYIIASALITPFTTIFFLRAKRQWQRGRRFMTALSDSLERFDQEHGP